MNRIALSGAALLAAWTLFPGCSPDTDSPESGDLGTAIAAVNNVPNDGTVACISITMTGSWATTQSFDVMPGQSTLFTLSGIPTGTVRFDSAAYPSACAQVLPTDTPTWVSVPVLATVVVGQTTQVSLNLQQAGGAGVGVGFNPNPVCRTAGMPCLAGSECCSGACGANNACLATAPMCAPQGAACAQSSDCCAGQCTNGVCQQPQCLVPSDCPGVDTECSVRACTAGSCGLVFSPAGLPVSAQTAGDCRLGACDGAGNVVNLIDDSDVPNDGNPCTVDLCAAGVPALVPVAAGTACGPGGLACDGTGLCVPPSTICGDGIVAGPEQCDDGNTVSGDGCSSSCGVEAGFTCVGSPSACSLAVACGDGIVSAGEGCDDGNTANNDGCSSKCQVESPYTCVGSPSVCTSPVEINCNDGVDNDGNGLTDCADPACALHCNASVGACGAGQTALVLSATALPAAIPDNNATGVSRFVNVGGLGVITRVVVQVDITHTFDSDLDLKLFSPNNVSTDVTSDNGSSSDNYASTIFNSACATAVTVGAAPFSGCFRPEVSFAGYNGAPASGQWRLTVSDDASGDTGTLNAWRLALCVAPSNCGDGQIDPGEACDDGNTTSGDGCSSICQTEP